MPFEKVCHWGSGHRLTAFSAGDENEDEEVMEPSTAKTTPPAAKDEEKSEETAPKPFRPVSVVSVVERRDSVLSPSVSVVTCECCECYLICSLWHLLVSACFVKCLPAESQGPG